NGKGPFLIEIQTGIEDGLAAEDLGRDRTRRARADVGFAPFADEQPPAVERERPADLGELYAVGDERIDQELAARRKTLGAAAAAEPHAAVDVFQRRSRIESSVFEIELQIPVDEKAFVLRHDVVVDVDRERPEHADGTFQPYATGGGGPIGRQRFP